MENENEQTEYKCGVCRWQMNTYCNAFTEHECFSNFNELLEKFVADDDGFIFAVPRQLEESSHNVGKLKWTHEAIMCLINLYKEHIRDFNSTKEKNDKVWGRLSCELIANGFNYSVNQCKFKFKYLKSKYMQKKDNMKATSSGQASITFRYFDEMDDIFGKKPNVRPRCLASNLVTRPIIQPTSNEREDILLDSENDAPAHEEQRENNNSLTATPKKASASKSGNIQQILNKIEENATVREAAREKRHKENLEFKNKLLISFNQKMDNLINVFNNN